MKTLSIKQPWASLIAYGYKEYEFRSWKTNYRGEFLIHASKSVDKKNLENFKYLNIPFETGKIIAKGYIDDCILAKDIPENLKKEAPLIYDKIREGYAFHIINTKLIEPIEINGKLSFWNYEKE